MKGALTGLWAAVMLCARRRRVAKACAATAAGYACVVGRSLWVLAA